MEYYDRRSQRRRRPRQTERLQRRREVLVEGLRRRPQKCEQVAVQALGARPIDCNVRDGEHLEQQAHSLIFVDCGTE